MAMDLYGLRSTMQAMQPAAAIAPWVTLHGIHSTVLTYFKLPLNSVIEAVKDQTTEEGVEAHDKGPCHHEAIPKARSTLVNGFSVNEK